MDWYPSLPSSTPLQRARRSIDRSLYSKLSWRTSQWLDRLARPENYRAAFGPSGKFAEAGALFIHIPKNAGMSIKRSLFPGANIGGHFRIRDFMMIFPEPEFHQLFKFSFVRNPWDRVFSAYTFLSSGGMNAKDKLWRDQHLNGVRNFEDFVLNFLPRPAVRQSLHFRDQLWWITDPSGILRVDMLARFENLAEDYREIAARLGRKDDLQTLNRSRVNESTFQKEYTSLAVDHVARLYATDINVLGYTFPPSGS